jgi:hypothetical protein
LLLGPTVAGRMGKAELIESYYKDVLESLKEQAGKGQMTTESRIRKVEPLRLVIFLEEKTAMLPHRKFLTNRGRYCLQRARGVGPYFMPTGARVSALWVRSDAKDPRAEQVLHLGDVIQFDWMPLDEERLEVSARCDGSPAAQTVLGELLAGIEERWPAETIGRPVATKANRIGPREKTRRIAETGLELKRKHPDWSRARVAMEAQRLLVDFGDINEETVRYAFKAMHQLCDDRKWLWPEPGDRATKTRV